MTITRKQSRKPSLRTLTAAELATATGGISFLGVEERGIIIYGSTGFTGGVVEALPAVQR